MAIGDTGALVEGIDKLFELSYHPRLKVFGSNFWISSLLDKESEKEGLIKTYKTKKEIPSHPIAAAIILNGVGEATVYYPQAEEKYNEIKPLNNKWEVRNLIKQGYRRV